MLCQQEKNLKNCTCTYPSCARAGICCQCVFYHRQKGQIPGCFFPKEGEKTFDRSIKNFIAWQKEKNK